MLVKYQDNQRSNRVYGLDSNNNNNNKASVPNQGVSYRSSTGLLMLANDLKFDMSIKNE